MLNFEVNDNQGDNHGEIHVKFSEGGDKYYDVCSISHSRSKETDRFVLVPIEKTAEMFEFTQSNCKTQLDLWGFDIDKEN